MPTPIKKSNQKPEAAPTTEHKCPCGAVILDIEPDDVLDVGYEAECEQGCLVVVESTDPVVWAEIDDDDLEGDEDGDDDDDDLDDDYEDDDDDDLEDDDGDDEGDD